MRLATLPSGLMMSGSSSFPSLLPGVFVLLQLPQPFSRIFPIPGRTGPDSQLDLLTELKLCP